MIDPCVVYLAVYFLGGTVAKWLIDFRIGPAYSFRNEKTLGEELWNDGAALYGTVMLIWPITLPVFTGVTYWDEISESITTAFGTLGKATKVWNFSITQAYEDAYKRLTDD